MSRIVTHSLFKKNYQPRHVLFWTFDKLNWLGGETMILCQRQRGNKLIFTDLFKTGAEVIAEQFFEEFRFSNKFTGKRKINKHGNLNVLSFLSGNWKYRLLHDIPEFAVRYISPRAVKHINRQTMSLLHLYCIKKKSKQILY